MKLSRDFQGMMAYANGGIVFVAAFAAYMKTLAPTVSFFDSGELITAAATFGVAHPPGYPLYALCGWLFSKLPVGPIAYRLNLMSAWFAALAALMAYLITYLIVTEFPAKSKLERVVQPVVAMTAALTFAFSITHWRQAVIAEVYALNAFLCGLILAIMLYWRRCQPRPRARSEKSERIEKRGLLYLAALLFGLGFGNHQTIILFSVAAAYLVLVTTPRILKQAVPLLLILACFGLGVSVYALIPLRAAARPPINWGHATTLRQFAWLVSREGYKYAPKGHAVRVLWNDALGRPPLNDAPETSDGLPAAQPAWRSDKRGLARVADVVAHSLLLKQFQTCNILQQFGCVGAMLAAIGFMYGVIRHRAPTVALLLAAAVFVVAVVFIGDPSEDTVFLVEEFHTPAYLVIAAWIGLGAMAVARGALWLARPYRLIQHVMALVLVIHFLLLPATQALGVFATVDRSRNYVAHDYASNILNSLKPNAMLLTWGDSGAFPLWYLQIVERLRPDVTLVHVPHLGMKWYIDELPPDFFAAGDPVARHAENIERVAAEIIERQQSKRPIYLDYSCAHSLLLPYQLLPHGITYKVKQPGDQLDEDVWSRYRFRGILDNTRIARDPDIDRVFIMYGAAQVELGNFYLALNDTEKAAQAFNFAIKFDPSLADQIMQELKAYNNSTSLDF